jgi:hypothetical protein
MLAAAAAVGSTPMGAMVLKRGVKLVNSAGLLNAMPSEVGEIIDVVRGDLVPAGKAAVSAAATSRVDALTGSLHERAEKLRDPGAAAAEAADETKRRAGEGAAAAKRTTGGLADTAKRRTRRADREDEEDLADEDVERDEDVETDDLGEESDDLDEDEDEADEEPVTRVRRTPTRRRTPVATKARR